MNKLLRTVQSIAIALLITGCTSAPHEDIDDRPWSNSMDTQLRGPLNGEGW